MRIEVLVDVKTELGEGPLWDTASQRLFWLDCTGRRIFRATADGREIRAWETPERIGSMAIRKGGGAVIAIQSGLYFFDFETEERALICDPEPDRPDNCLNDGKVDRRGRFFVGSMDTKESGGHGALYRLDPDLSLHRLDSGIIVSNGPCWSPDDRTFYFQDSWKGEIWAYDYDVETGSVSNRRTFAKLDTTTGAADGSTVDAEGGLWNAQIFDSCLVRYTPDGRIDRKVELPVKKVTSVMFGGPNLDILYVTSMGRQLFPHFPPDGVQRGSVFAVHGLGVQGLPETPFGG